MASNSDWRFDRGVAVVPLDLEIFVFIIEDGSGAAQDAQRGISEWCAAQLQRNLLVVVAVDVTVTAGPDEVAHVQVALLRHQVGEQGVAGDVEGIWHIQPVWVFCRHKVHFVFSREELQE